MGTNGHAMLGMLQLSKYKFASCPCLGLGVGEVKIVNSGLPSLQHLAVNARIGD